MDADSDNPKITMRFEDDPVINEIREILKFFSKNCLVKNAVFRYREFEQYVDKIQRNIQDILQQKILYNQISLK